MRIRHQDAGRQRDLVVHFHDPAATVADLADALYPCRSDVALMVDERTLGERTPLIDAGISDGALVQAADDLDIGPPTKSWVVVLVVTAGRDAGRRFGLPPGRTLLCRRAAGEPAWSEGPRRARIDDASVAGHEIEVDVDAAGTVAIRRGRARFRPIDLDIELTLGQARVRWEAVAAHRPDRGSQMAAGLVGPSGTRPLHRRARPSPEPDPPTVELPPLPPPQTPGGGMGPVTLLASAASGLAMVVLFRSWAYAVFALFGPVVAVAGTFDARRRARPRGWRYRRRRRRLLGGLDEALADHGRAVLAGLVSALPGPGSVLRTVASPEREGCWTRRLGDPDAVLVRVGRGTVPVNQPSGPAASPPDIAAVLANHRSLPDAPVGLALSGGHALAIVGDRDAARALARALVTQLTVAHGPADLEIEIVAEPATEVWWQWCCWLPHRVPAPEGRDAVDGPAEEERPIRLVLIDDGPGLAARRSRAREALADLRKPGARVASIVVVDDVGSVPAACRTVLAVDGDGSLSGPAELLVGCGRADGVHLETAREMAAGLAALDDPERADPDRDLPAAVALVDLIGQDVTTTAGIAQRWAGAGRDPSPLVVLGADDQGSVEVDLSVDGPHALVAGTTGSGKSELLRTLVAGLAAGADPDHLAFVLIDFKGGSAFDSCAGLPHVAGMVTDLDEELAARALRGLEAELLRREEVLAANRAEDLTDLRRRSQALAEPFPRLVVVVDEFATLASTLPDFVDTLVGIAQRGRSLGFHLVLATQRPGGAVSEHLRANTGLRVALRVHAASDSNDVVGDPRAASLPRRLPGRAVLRRGPEDLATMQCARITTEPADAAVTRVSINELQLGSGPLAGPLGAPPTPGATDLDALVAAARAAWAGVGGSPPRCPWPPPLPRTVPWPDPDHPALEGVGPPRRLSIGRGDAPSRRSTAAWWWDLDQGPLLVIGVPGTGTSTTLATAALAAARGWTPTDLHIHVVDLGAGTLGPLAGLPHVGATIGGDDEPRQRRLFADLARDLAGRLALAGPIPAESPRRLLILDGLLAFQKRWDLSSGDEPWQALVDLLSQGPAVGMYVAMAAEGPGVPRAVLAAVRQRLVLALGDRADAAWLGLPSGALPAEQPPGRAIASVGPSPVQLAQPTDGIGAAAAMVAGHAHDPAGGPRPLGQLRTVEPLEDLPASTATGPPGDTVLRLVMGRLDSDLGPAVLVLPAGSTALVAGPPRSGRTTTLLVALLGAIQAGWAVVAVRREPGPVASVAPVVAPGDPRLPTLLASIGGPTLVVVDDADGTEADDPTLRALVTDRAQNRIVVVSGRSDRLRANWSHWTREARVDRRGILLDPDPDLDGELLATRVPRHRPAGLRSTAGLGWLVGETEGHCQVAWPCSTDAEMH